ncbi:MAG: MFS transporter [Xanthobacteraceae bacterium]|nr:MFS transporter [Xanthobacteraceae bacterium]PWB62848.1 MAG: MFS transporter [Bradyrhizobiaceae bacterium]
MAIHSAYAQVYALLAAVFILIAGNGLFTTLVPLAATAASFSDLTLGFIGSGYFAGMLVGCLAAPRIVARAGHIRAFAAFVSVASVSALAHPLYVDPLAWGVIRSITGFCFAGLYATMESWLHDKADNVVRGRLMALYQIVHYAGSASGQQAIRFVTPSSFVPFSMVAAALALAVLPLALTRTDPPSAPPVPRLRLAWLYRISPVAVAGVFAAGIANGTMWSLAPAFAERSGLDPGGVASFMTAVILGAAAVQWPIGRIADRHDRRFVMLIAMVIAAAAEIALAAFAESPPMVLISLAAAVGASSLVLYPLSSSHAQDLGGRENAVEVSSALLLTYTIGAVVGPTTAAWLMDRIGPEALFMHNAAVHVVLVALIVLRLWQRPPKTESDV